MHPEAAAHVHHMILYVCDGLDSLYDQLTPEQLDGGPCFSGASGLLGVCSGRTIIAAWAVGGQVRVYACNVSFEICLYINNMNIESVHIPMLFYIRLSLMPVLMLCTKCTAIYLLLFCCSCRLTTSQLM